MKNDRAHFANTNGAHSSVLYTLGTARGTIPANSVYDPASRFAQIEYKVGYSHNTAPQVHCGLEPLDLEVSYGESISKVAG
jgi:hypothetical protein